MKHAWRSWYDVATTDTARALREAKRMATADHPDTPESKMMTPHIKLYADRTSVMVIGRGD